jgi:hypothetical protein
MLRNSNWKYKKSVSKWICTRLKPQGESCYNFIKPQYIVKIRFIPVTWTYLSQFVSIKSQGAIFFFYLIHIHTFNWNIFQDEIKLISGSHAHCILLNNTTMSTKMFNNTLTSKYDCSPLSSRRTTILILIHGTNQNCLPSTAKVYKCGYLVPMSVRGPAISPDT